MGQLELTFGGEEGGMEHEAEGEILARFGLPVVPPLPDAGSLLQSPIASEVLHLREVEGFTILVCRLQRVKLFNFQFSIRLT